MTENTHPKKIFIMTGEPSGDQLAVPLLRSLKDQFPNADFMGVGHESLNAVGGESLFPMSDLSVMGLTEVLPRLPLLLKRIKQTTETILREKPDVVIGFDSPDFCFRVMKRVHRAKQKNEALSRIKLFHVVAPTVWAWRPKRARKIARFLDHLFCLFPFEPPYFHREGLAATYIGHPFLPAYRDIKPAFIDGIPKKAEIIGLFPGSRRGEIERHLPLFLSAARTIHKANNTAHFVVLTLPHLEPMVRGMVEKTGLPITLTTDTDHKPGIIKACQRAIATSGTIGFELALAGVPHLIAYTMNPLTAFFARRMVKTPHVHLANIHLGRRVVPELIQENCTADRIARSFSGIKDDEQKAGFQDMWAVLDGEKKSSFLLPFMT